MEGFVLSCLAIFRPAKLEDKNYWPHFVFVSISLGTKGCISDMAVDILFSFGKKDHSGEWCRQVRLQFQQHIVKSVPPFAIFNRWIRTFSGELFYSAMGRIVLLSSMSSADLVKTWNTLSIGEWSHYEYSQLHFHVQAKMATSVDWHYCIMPSWQVSHYSYSTNA